jgi:type II secretory pathway component GspD/PulD (secretin)
MLATRLTQRLKVVLATAALALATALSAAAQSTVPPGTYQLIVEEGRISLDANVAPLGQILEDLGQELQVEVVARVVQEDTVTERFEDLSLEDALDRLGSSYLYVKDQTSGNGGGTRIIVLPNSTVAPAREIVPLPTTPVTEETAEREQSTPEGDKMDEEEEHEGDEREADPSFERNIDPSQHREDAEADPGAEEDH